MHRMVNNSPYKKEGPERPRVLSVIPKCSFHPKSKHSFEKWLPLFSLVYNCTSFEFPTNLRWLSTFNHVCLEYIAQGGAVNSKVCMGVCWQGCYTLTLINTKSIYFTTLFKLRNHNKWPKYNILFNNILVPLMWSQWQGCNKGMGVKISPGFYEHDFRLLMKETEGI